MKLKFELEFSPQFIAASMNLLQALLTCVTVVRA